MGQSSIEGTQMDEWMGPNDPVNWVLGFTLPLMLLAGIALVVRAIDALLRSGDHDEPVRLPKRPGGSTRGGGSSDLPRAA
jgi:hypothetical protein